MLRCISWNIDSLNAALTSASDRAQQTREVLAAVAELDADIVAIQETKLPFTGMPDNLAEILSDRFPGYAVAYVSSQPPAKKSYAGTMILHKKELAPAVNAPAIGAPDTMDLEGRVLTLESDGFYFVNVYTPNAGDGLKRLGDRQRWDVLFADYLEALDRTKPVIVCGDFNVAHREIDLANPESNHMSAGFTDEERAGFTALLGRGFTDSFRYMNGGVTGVYSWWSQRIRTAKMNNAGWRIDYFLVSDRVRDRIQTSVMVDSGTRPDHCPILLDIDL